MDAKDGSPIPPKPRRSFDPGSVLLVVLLVGFVLAAWCRPSVAERSAPLPLARASIDPNQALWHELAALPRIGESLAHRIIHFREATRHDGGDAERTVFTSAEDLARVRGIGPKTLERIRPFLAPIDPPPGADTK